MPGWEFTGYGSFTNYYSMTNRSNEALVLFGGKFASKKSGTTLSIGAGPDLNYSKGNSKTKPLVELKATQKIASAGDFTFKGTARARYTDNKTQVRGAISSEYNTNKGVSPYAAAHFTTKDKVNTTGGWIGLSGKNWFSEYQLNYNLNSKKVDNMINIGFNF